MEASLWTRCEQRPRRAGYRDVCRNLLEPDDGAAGRTCRSSGRGPPRQGWAAGRSHRQAHWPSAQDKFTVKDSLTENVIWWNNGNKPMDPAAFDRLHDDFLLALADKDHLYVADLFGGSQPEHRVRVRVVNELAWHNLFIRTLLVRPEAGELPGFEPEYTIIDLPSFRADPERHGSRSETVVAVNFTKKLILIGGTRYAGEMKKSVFGIAQLHPAAAGHHADALLGQYRTGRRHGDILRAKRHRQDDAVGRPEPHPDRRRRAWLVGHRGLQLRGRLLCQDDPPVGAEAEPEIYATTQALRHGARECRDRPGDARARPRRSQLRRE